MGHQQHQVGVNRPDPAFLRPFTSFADRHSFRNFDRDHSSFPNVSREDDLRRQVLTQARALEAAAKRVAALEAVVRELIDDYESQGLYDAKWRSILEGEANG
jgi:hypothetical protein